MLFGVGCTPDGGKTEGDEAMAEIAVNPSSFATTLEGGEQVIAVTSNGTWTVSCDQADVTVEPLTGVGNGSVTITVPAAAAREFKVVFDAQKQTLIPALGTTTTTTAKAELVVSQNAGGVNQSNFLYYEKVGEDVEKVTLDNGSTAWPYIDQFNGWTPEGDAAANVTYTGKSASVRHSGNAYEPTADAVGISGAPYAFINKAPAEAYFVIENIAVTGGSNYIFTYNVSCQNAYNGGTPGFATVDGSLVHLELGYDGQNWDAVECTFAPNGGNGWYAVTAQFKVAANATKLYARFTYEVQANGGCRLDDFKLVAGGDGAELAPEAPVTPDPTPDPTPADAYFYESFANSQGAFTTNDVTLGEGLTYVWKHDASYACMKASAYSGSAKASESWLISPEFSLAGATSPVLSFDHAINHAKGTAAEALTLWVKESTATEWTQVTIPSYPASDSWTFYPAGSADLSAYVNKTIQIAFKYTSTTSIAATWEVKNVKVAESSATTDPEQPGQGGGETPETPETPTTPIEGTYTKIDRAANVSAGTYLMAGYSESYYNSSNQTTTTFSPYPWHFWTGGQTTTSGKMYLYTVNYSYVDGALTLNPNLSSQDAAKGTAAEIELVAVDGKANTYCIKYNGKYLNCTGKHTIALVDNAVEWTFEDHAKGGIKITDNTTSGGVILGTAGATYNMLRCYTAPASSLVYGVAFFKKN